MLIDVGQQKLFFEVIGTKLRIAKGGVSEVPTVVFVHGGPAWDHLTLRMNFEQLQDVAQLIFYDHRGLGRSDVSTPAHWTLEQWAADLHGLIKTLGLEKPIVLGQSFGGMVAQKFAIDYPDDYSAIILSATAARFNLPEIVETFGTLGGPELRETALSFFTASGVEYRDRFLRECFPYYTVSTATIGALSPFKPDVLDHFFSDAGDGRFFDYRHALAAITKPVLVLGGDKDPVISPQAVCELAACFRPGIAELEIFDNCGHGPTRDRPEVALKLLRAFIQKVVPTRRVFPEPEATESE
ncbi:alpha/beta fold hydrolase [Komagataeibacter swingsii]|uniref:AB hydrolase-1 domain-containing protein n=1 Tax=Komagataeibacter swingsii TaxID=215220 RepID=A0A2V4S1P7_9PROT|nr:alpha/beta hydrolase [Komagataeibacter swingsii]PYD69029.1 hypothetical protein CFR76_12155 [Komagataeibacter swingsii]GBQ56921.1 alpha/beta hydrolase [Komagataeibacter swingsii DSM 16373]